MIPGNICFFLIAISCSFLNTLVYGQTLEVVNDDELLDLFRTENYVLVLFCMYTFQQILIIYHSNICYVQN